MRCPEFITLNGAYEMELNYMKEHTSCVNYKTKEYEGFSLGQALAGENFDNQEQEIKANHLIFILSGEVEITKDEKEKVRVRENEFVFIPISSHYVGKVISPGRYINLTFFHNNISLCDKHMLSSYLGEVEQVPACFEALPVREPLGLFIGLLENYLNAGVNCRHLHEIKERELFIIFRTAYTKREMVRLFHPIMGKEFDFKIAVLQHRDRVRSKKEMALVLGMSNSDLQRKFMQEFGEPVSVWLQKQKNRKILSRLSFDSVSIKEIVHEFGFSSAASFNKYCKSNFGCNPTELRKKIKEYKIE